jgi:phosphate transport system substrate-binding protein
VRRIWAGIAFIAATVVPRSADVNACSPLRHRTVTVLCRVTGFTTPSRDVHRTYDHVSHARAHRDGDMKREERSHTVKHKAIIVVALATALVAAACASGATTARRDTTLTGAGSTFVFPLVSQWIPQVQTKYGIKITYGPIGSGGGIANVTNRTVDFGASDAPLSADQFAACKGCVQIPWALSATSIPYNVPGAPARIKLSGKVLADIFLDKIKKWNDPRIQQLNNGASLPNLNITPIHRSDNSGTTYNFTEYLSRVSAQWKSRVGKGVAVNWPTGISGKGSSGVAAALTQTPGGITYIDVAYSLKNHFKFAAIQNAAQKFTLPGLRQIAAAASTVKRVAARNSGISIVNPGKKYPTAYPISTFTYVIVPEKTAKAKELRQFIGWALTGGQRYGPKLLFQPIPKVVLDASMKTLKLIHT